QPQNQTTRDWYDTVDRARFTLDAEGYLHETRYADAARQRNDILYTARPSLATNATLADVQNAATSLANGALDRDGTTIPNQNTVTLDDAAGRVKQVTDAEGYVTKYFYDAVGNRIETDRALDL